PAGLRLLPAAGSTASVALLPRWVLRLAEERPASATRPLTAQQAGRVRQRKQALRKMRRRDGTCGGSAHSSCAADHIGPMEAGAHDELESGRRKLGAVQGQGAVKVGQAHE